MNNDKKITFKAIPLKEVIIIAFVLGLLLYQSTEWIILPLSKGNTRIQTKLVMFLGTMISIVYIFLQHKRSLNLTVKISETAGIFKRGEKNISVRSLKIHSFLWKKVPAKIIRINQSILLIMPVYKSPFDQINKDQKNNFKQDIDCIKKFSDNNKMEKWTNIDCIPRLINFIMYLLIVFPFLAALFFLIYIFHR